MNVIFQSNKPIRLMVACESKIIDTVLITILMLSCYLSIQANNVSQDPLSPPDNAKFEIWDCDRSNASGRIDNGLHPTEVVIVDDSLYFVFYKLWPESSPYASGSCWVKGRIDGNKVIIENGLDLYGIGALYSAKYWSKSIVIDQYVQNYWYTESLNEDIIFDFDLERKWLHNPSATLWFSMDGTSYVSETSKDFIDWPEDLYPDYELIYIPEGPLTPQPPKFIYETGLDEKKYIVLNGNIFSKEGPAMRCENLSFRIYIDGKQDPLQDLDFWYWRKAKPTNDGWNYIQLRMEYDKPFKEAYAELVYKYEDGSEVVSARAPLVDVSGVDEVFRDDVEDIDAPVYDLSGRRVKPNQLAPGIYIRNGKKFLVR